MRKISATAIDCTAMQIGQIELAGDVSTFWLFTEAAADGKLQTWMACTMVKVSKAIKHTYTSHVNCPGLRSSGFNFLS